LQLIAHCAGLWQFLTLRPNVEAGGKWTNDLLCEQKLHHQKGQCHDITW